MLYEAIDDAFEIPARAFIRTDKGVVRRLLAQLGLSTLFGPPRSRALKQSRVVEVPNHLTHWLYFARLAAAREADLLYVFMALPKTSVGRENAARMCSAFLNDARLPSGPRTVTVAEIPESLLPPQREKEPVTAVRGDAWAGIAFHSPPSLLLPAAEPSSP